MKTFKQAAVVIATLGMVSMQAHAGEAAVKTTPAPQPMAAFSQQDINGLFDQADKPMQLAALSKQEMKETEGAWWFVPVIAWTAGGAALGAIDSWRRTGGVNWRDVGAGATSGLYASPVGRVFGNVGRFALGTLGASSWYTH